MRRYILLQLHGEKRVLLFPPRAGAGLYLVGRGQVDSIKIRVESAYDMSA